jgi:hypothetical protein
MKTLLLAGLAGLLLTTSTQAQRRPRPQAWHCPAGPPYLPSRLPRRPSQHYLDSLAAAARPRPLLTAK